MTLLILGLALWVLAHWFKRLAPDARAKLGDPGKGVVALLIVAGVVLMIFGYRAADFIPVWTPPAWTIHLNNLLMILAFWIYGSSAAKGAKAWPAYKTRHPQLIGFKTWAIAHLLVNGDLASILLFGGLLAWAVSEVILINRAGLDAAAQGRCQDLYPPRGHHPRDRRDCHHDPHMARRLALPVLRNPT